MIGMKRRTIYDIIKRIENGGSPTRKTGSGRPRRVLTPKQVDNLVEQSVGKVGGSYRKLGKKFNMDHKTMKEVFKYGIIKKKRKNGTKSTEKQKIKQRQRIRKLYEGQFKPTLPTEIIIDDECYLTLDGNEWCENEWYFDC